MAGQGEQGMTQEQLNMALLMACGSYHDLARAEELIGRGADLHAIVGAWNALHCAAMYGLSPIVRMLLRKGALVDRRTGISTGLTALYWAGLYNRIDTFKLLIDHGADLRIRDNMNESVLTEYGDYAYAHNGEGLDPLTKRWRVTELIAYFRAGPHPSQVQRRKDEAWAKRWPFMSAMYGCGFLLLVHKAAALKAQALPTDAKIPDELTATPGQRHSLQLLKVFGNVGLVRRIAGFIQDKE